MKNGNITYNFEVFIASACEHEKLRQLDFRANAFSQTICDESKNIIDIDLST